MPRFISNSGSFQDLIVSGSRLYVASSSIFFNNLATSSTAPNVLLLDSTGQVYYTASNALSAAPQTFNTSSLLTTASVSSNTIQFTKGDASTFSLTVNTGSAVTVNTGSLLTTASVSSNVITFTKGDTSQFSLTINTGSAVTVSTASLLTTASVSSNVITFTKGNGDTFPITVNTGSSAPTSFIATGSVTASVNVGSTAFQITSGSNTLFLITSESRVGIGGITSPNSILHVSSSFRVTGGNGRGQLIVSSDDSVQVGPTSGAAGNAKFVVYGGTSNGTSTIDLGHNGNYAASIGVNDPGDLIINPVSRSIFMVGGNEKARINNSGNVAIGTTADSGHKLYISGSGTSGSFNANNVLFVSGSNVSISGSFTVVSGSTEFQVLGTGIKMGNTGSDTHTMTGSFGVQTTPIGGNLPGGIRVSAGVNNVDYATYFTIGNYTLTAQRTNELYFQGNSPGDSGIYFLGTQMYTGQANPRFILGGATGPNNVSYMSVGANTGSEYASSGNYPSASNNFFLINTNLSAASLPSIQRRSLYIGAQDIRFFVSASTNNDSFSSATPVMTIGSGSTVTITGSTNVLKVIGSGSINPIFTVQGSQGELFSVTDSLSGSLFSVNDVSGLPILDVNSDQTTKIGSYLAPGLYSSTRVTANTGVTVIYSIPTASYDSAYFDYNIRSGSVGRAGSIIAMWSGSSVNYSEVSASSFGTTNTFVLGVSISGSNMILSGSAPSNGWTVKTIIRSI
jgi:hypothetical protein